MKIILNQFNYEIKVFQIFVLIGEGVFCFFFLGGGGGGEGQGGDV